jgi:hypothetical protein
MGLFDKVMKIAGGLSGGAGSDAKKEEIRNIFNAKVQDGGSYSVLAGTHMVTAKKLMKEVRTYYNYIIGYKDGDDPEIILISTSNDLASVDEPALCKKSECAKAEYLQDTATFSISHPSLGDEPVDFEVIASAAWGAPGTGALVIPVSYLDEYGPFAEFFQNHFAK